MTRVYLIALTVEAPGIPDNPEALDELDHAVREVVDNCTAREAIDVGLAEARPEAEEPYASADGLYVVGVLP